MAEREVTKTVFFDFDGVLIDSMPAHIRAWKETLAQEGISVDELYIELHEGEKAEATVARLLKENHRPNSSTYVSELIERKRSIYRPNAPRGLNRDARALVDQLNSRRIECNIVTGSIRKNLDAALSEEELSLFNHIISADDYEAGKPAPDPYLTGLRRSGYSAGECRVLENAPLGIRSARSAGMFTVAITTTLPPEYLSEANVIIRNYQDFLNHV